MMIAKRRLGRPPLDPRSHLPSTVVTLRLAAKDYVRVRQLADRERASVQEVIRRVLTQELQNKRIGRLE